MNSQKYVCPAPLYLARQVGEHHLLVAGGVLDQPIIWTAVQYARYIDQLIDRTNAEGFKVSSLNADEMKLHDTITDIRRELLSQ
jgi:hypothetical protein